MSFGFVKSDAYLEIYFMVIVGDPLIFVVYVDDLFPTGAERLIVGCKRELVSNFKIKDLSDAFFLVIRGWHKLIEIFLKLGKYTLNVLGYST